MARQTYRIAPFLARAEQVARVSLVRVLARAGLSASLAGKDLSVDAATWFNLLEATVTEADGPETAVALGRALAGGPLHPALLAFAASSDLQTGLERLAIFKPLIAPVRMILQASPTDLTIEWAADADRAALSPAAVLMEMAYLLELLCVFSARQIRPLSVTFMKGTDIPESFRAWVDCPIKCGSATRLRLGRMDATLPIISADTSVLRAIEGELLSQLRALPNQPGLADRLRHEIRLALPSGRVAMRDLARRLCVSVRSLQRHLQQEGLSFQTILEETRAELAMVYLRERQLSAEETSHLLAYRDPNSFYRAFRDWTGMTPAEARGLHAPILASSAGALA